MTSTSCKIHFNNNPYRVFFGGQLLSGRVVLTLTKSKTVRGIFVKVIGRAFCRWTTGGGKSSTTHVGEEFYLNEKTFLVGSDSGDVVLTPNVYNYTFNCMLPPGLPTSVEGKSGYIRYSVVVHIDRLLWSDRRFEEFFTILKPLNLNDEIVLRYPLVGEDRKTYFICCLLCCCTSGELVMNGCVPVGGYVPGQEIELLLKINNGSDQTFENFVIQIIKHIRYHTYANSSNTKIDKLVIKSVTCDGCPKSQSKTYSLSITVPSVPPTDESTSNIVKVSYLLQIRGSAGCSRKDPTIIFPIKIGTFPIMPHNTIINQQPTVSSHVSYGTQPQHSDCLNSTSFVDRFPHPSLPDATDIDPPTYEEAISNFPDDAETFRPSYPVFRRTPSYYAKSNI